MQQQPKEFVLVLIKLSGHDKGLEYVGRFQAISEVENMEYRVRNGPVPDNIIEQHLVNQPPEHHQQIRQLFREKDILAMVMEGTAGFIERVKAKKYDMIRKANESLRKRGIKPDKWRNYIHSSQNVDEAKQEIDIWMPWINDKIEDDWKEEEE